MRKPEAHWPLGQFAIAQVGNEPANPWDVAQELLFCDQAACSRDCQKPELAIILCAPTSRLFAQKENRQGLG